MQFNMLWQRCLVASPDLKAYAWQPGAGWRGPCWPYVRLSGAYLGPMFAYVSRMLPQVGPMLAHVGPTLALCWPKLALCWPYVGPTLRHRHDAFCPPMFKHLQHVIFSVRPPPRTPKPRKTPGFLTHCQDKIPGDRRAPNTVKHEVEQWLLQKIGIFGAFFPKFHAVGTLKIRANSQNLIFC